MSAAAELRTQLKTFEGGLRRARRHLASGGNASELRGVLDIVSARETLSVAAAGFQAERHVSRVSVFRVQRAEGMSLGAIARAWGLSRQLVSRMLREDGSRQARAS